MAIHCKTCEGSENQLSVDRGVDDLTVRLCTLDVMH